MTTGGCGRARRACPTCGSSAPRSPPARPDLPGLGPAPAVRRLLDRPAVAARGIALADIGAVEITEAFASVVLAVIDDLGLDEDLVCARGRRDRARPPVGRVRHDPVAPPGVPDAAAPAGPGLGLAACAIGGGQGLAMLLERPEALTPVAEIRFTAVHHRFGDRVVLDGIDLTLTERRVGIVGANGSGKSTLARMINGLVSPTSGTVTVDGLDTTAKGREVRRRVGFVFTDPDNQIVMPTVAEDVGFSLRRSGLSKAGDRRAGLGRR